MFNSPTTVLFPAARANGNQTPDAASLARLAWLAADYQEQQTRYQRLRAWHDGDHRVPLTDRQRQYLALDSHFPFALNYLKLPVDLCVERLTVLHFDGPEGIGGDDGLLAQWWMANRMDSLQGQVHRAAVVDGDTYVLVEWDNVRNVPIFSHESAWDGTTGMKVHYVGNRRREMTFASKRWTETRVMPDGRGTTTTQRLNIYTANEVQRFEAARGTWQPYEPPGDPPWREAWPIGVIPVVHFRWRDNGSEWGQSEIEQLIPLQQALNHAALAEIEAADKTGAQVLTLTGARWPVGAQVAAGDVLAIEKGDASWGVIPPGDISQLRNRIDDYIQRMAQLSQIPIRMLQVGGQVSSGESQAADDSLIVAKVRSQSVALGNAWEDVMTIALMLNAEYGDGRGLGDGMLTTHWDTFERVDRLMVESRRAEVVAALTAAGGSLAGALAQAGYSEEAVQRLLQGDTVTGIEQ